MQNENFVKNQIDYLTSCYFLWLERPTDPLDLSPAKSYGEDIVIGHHIKTVKRLRKWFKNNEFSQPLFDPSTVYETIGKLRLIA
ncbi:hypothetical protein [Acinetobacter colistiniresistens]|uniref:hypothetical protein n=1 Tax=Acinetobacter colistiniresistens TaxID=280145 RepID=UPI000FDA0405|nr:hypothetical protein [Acinetobacter colistiniresistens]